MLINPMHYKRNSPEVLMQELTQAHFFLYRYKTIKEVLNRDESQAAIDKAMSDLYKKLKGLQVMARYIC